MIVVRTDKMRGWIEPIEITIERACEQIAIATRLPGKYIRRSLERWGYWMTGFFEYRVQDWEEAWGEVLAGKIKNIPQRKKGTPELQWTLSNLIRYLQSDIAILKSYPVVPNVVARIKALTELIEDLEAGRNLWKSVKRNEVERDTNPPYLTRSVRYFQAISWVKK